MKTSFYLSKLNQAILTVLAITVTTNVFAWKEPQTNKGPGSNNQILAGCTPATTYTDMDINNVKFTISTGGDFWYNPNIQASYEIPKGSGRHSMYAGGLWLGGQDVSGQLKVAGLIYRSSGEDYWPGPLSTENFEIDAATCAAYDRHFESTRQEVKEFASWYACSQDPLCDESIEFANYSIPDFIVNWPAHGRNFDPYNEDFYLAPFYDNNNDGIYNPFDGDYPGYDLHNKDCGERRTDVYGDANLWWVFNDKGNVHTSSGANSIGMEIRAQAFAFATNDEVNSMTFYNYELINRSSYTLTETYFGVFADTDIGGYDDDFVGCDVMRGLGYCYNGDDTDTPVGGAQPYAGNPPAVGIDFFEGPYQDNDGIDNAVGIGENEALNGVGYGDGVADNERFGMRRFVYFSRQGSNWGTDPDNGSQYYNYLRGMWKDGVKMTHGGDGHSGTIETDFMFPGDSDPLHWGTSGVDPNDTDPRGWTEETAGNTPADRRFVQSAGPFTLLPGAVNDITVGVVWAQAASGGSFASVELLKRADLKTQNMFDNCFQVLDGPDAPVLLSQELDREIILYITNPSISNNYQEKYRGKDPSIIAPDSAITVNESGDSVYVQLSQQDKNEYSSYKFQGYKVYQVKDNTVDASSLNDIEKARLVYQCDIRDSVSTIINFGYDLDLNMTTAEVMVEGSNEGINHAIQIKEDLFATGDRKLINYKSYCFIAIAYAYNNFKSFDPNNPNADAQTTPYLESRKSPTGGIKPICITPRRTDPENGGTILQSSFGDALEITRIEGIGNGGNFLNIKSESLEQATSGEPWVISNPVYEKDASPIRVRVIDPLNVVKDTFSVKFTDTTTLGDLTDAYWEIWRKSDPEDTRILSSNSIEKGYEELFPDWGISVLVEQSEQAGENLDGNYGIIDARIEFEDATKPWLSGIGDIDGDSLFDWIRIGSNTDNGDWENYENHTAFESILDATWAPARLCSQKEWGPFPDDMMSLQGTAFLSRAMEGIFGDLSQLNNVDIVFTLDRTKWTRCPVIEMGWAPENNKGEIGVGPSTTSGGSEIPGALKGRLRQSPSVDKSGNTSNWPIDNTASSNVDDPNFIGAYGMSWFPGYAIDVVTGERLNMAFAENSSSLFEAERGSDMQWNPTDRVVDNGPLQGARLGGEHYIYVFRNNEDRQNDPSVSLVGINKYFYDTKEKRMPAYDYGEFAFNNLSQSSPSAGTLQYDDRLIAVYGACTWVGFPVVEEGEDLLSTNATVKLRVSQKFKTYGTEDKISEGETLIIGDDYWVSTGPIVHGTDTLNRGDYFTATTSEFTSLADQTTDLLIHTINSGLPLYNFSTYGLEALTGLDSVAQNELGNIQVVPNPYYAYSSYEDTKLDNRVKVINLPEECTVTIYSINGTLIRQISKDDPTQTWVDWDLKNYAYIPIASGVYLVHIEAPGIGERVIKWFGALRPTDLDSF